MTTKELGQIGEKYALQWLTATGHKIIKTNFTWRQGEMDIISYDTWNKELVFTEVKSRTGNSFGDGEESLSHQKIERLIKTAFHFMGSFMRQKMSWRMDLIALKLTKKGVMRNISHFKNILDE